MTTSSETSSPSFAPFEAPLRDVQLIAAAVDRHDAPPPSRLAENAERPLRLPLQQLDDARGEAAALIIRRQAGEHPVADAGGARLPPLRPLAPEAMTMRGALPHSSSHSTGTPIASP